LTTHLSLRLAWHDNGWNGHICKNPKANFYCSGRYSYEAEMIRKDKNLEIEISNQGKHSTEIKNLNYTPPCCFGINAFSNKETNCYKKPQVFFNDDTKVSFWKMPPASACTWPFEEMYKEEVKTSGNFDANKRLKAMKEYFSKFEESKSLIFHYLNYDNPFNKENKDYIIVGISTLKKIGDEIKWENQSSDSVKKFGNVVWGRIITSDYPLSGFRIPYEKYIGDEEVLNKLLFIPENNRLFKYGTRHISDDDALSLIEHYIEIANYLKEIGDSSENWQDRIDWLSSCLGTLWKNRGVYPGLSSVLDFLEAPRLIPFIKNSMETGVDEKEIYKNLIGIIKKRGSIEKSNLFNNYKDCFETIIDRLDDFDNDENKLLLETLPRFDFNKEQIKNILSPKRKQNGLYSSTEEILNNPYTVCEEYIGDNIDDNISFNKIDNGFFLSPKLGVENEYDKKDIRRFRSLIIDSLKKITPHSFTSAEEIIEMITKKLDFMPDWKKTDFNLNRLLRKKEQLESKIYFKDSNEKKFIYLKDIYKFESIIGQTIQEIAARPEIKLDRPVTTSDWKIYIYNEDCKLNKENQKIYQKIIDYRIDQCKTLFIKPISIISGEAGTGKTTIVKAIIKAIRKAHGEGSSFQLLAPTGKAAERLRKATGESADTIHSFLAQRGWLYKNFSFAREGGSIEEDKKTVIIDESSMIDLHLLGTLFKSINFHTVKRLIFVGDYNQLPPIGIGKPFVDIVNWIKKSYPDNIVVLSPNLRAIENKGLSLRLASIFTDRFDEVKGFEKDKFSGWEEELYDEDILRKVQEGGEISKDLKVVYWNDEDELKELIKDEIKNKAIEIENDIELSENNVLYKIFKSGVDSDPDKLQLITPYRSEEYGVEAINQFIQREFNNYCFQDKGSIGGITYFDKVIQYINRLKSNPYNKYEAYSFKNGRGESLEVYNGETGFIYPHSFDKKNWKWGGFKLKRFQAKFKGKEDYRVSYKSSSSVEENIELAYAISVHKAQGSEFDNVFFILPNKKSNLLSKELFYTGVTRAKFHTTLFIEKNIEPLLRLRRRENSIIIKINSSILKFVPIPEVILQASNYYEEGKIHRTLIDIMVRSKSEALIANMLYSEGIKFDYEKPLYASDGTMYLPDFTIYYMGDEWYWEHLGLLGNRNYEKHWEKKKKWYRDNNYFEKLYTTEEKSGADSKKWLAGFLEKLGKWK